MTGLKPFTTYTILYVKRKKENDFYSCKAEFNIYLTVQLKSVLTIQRKNSWISLCYLPYRLYLLVITIGENSIIILKPFNLYHTHATIYYQKYFIGFSYFQCLVLEVSVRKNLNYFTIPINHSKAYALRTARIFCNIITSWKMVLELEKNVKYLDVFIWKNLWIIFSDKIIHSPFRLSRKFLEFLRFYFQCLNTIRMERRWRTNRGNLHPRKLFR